jgi:hypothetical protein
MKIPRNATLSSFYFASPTPKTNLETSQKYVNSLAAMPSMHFGYSFCIGCTMIYHSGMFRSKLEPQEKRKSLPWKIFFVLFGIAYPAFVFITIIATANHYFLDVLVAVAVVTAAFLCNRVFLVLLPLEDLLFWSLRLEKPIPVTGCENGRRREMR